MKLKKRYLVLALNLCMVVFSVFVLTISSFAWFIANRNTNLTYNSISVGSGLSIKAKYYKYNFKDGDTSKKYCGYTSTTSGIESVNYETDFAEPTKELTNTLFNIANSAPQFRYTFAIEVISNFTYEKLIKFNLSNFISLPSKTEFDLYKKSGICLASAISITGTSFTYSTAENASTFATNFINSTSHVNSFNFDLDEKGPYEISNSLIFPYTAVTNTVVFLFTIGYSDSESTYYSEYSTDNNITNYVKNVNGNSTAYSGLSFEIKELSIVPRNVNEVWISLNGATNSTIDTKKPYFPSVGEAMSFLSNFEDPTRNGYTFAGWFDKIEGGTQYTATSTMVKGLSHLYAHWTPDTSTLTLDYSTNGGTSISPNVTTYGVTYGSSIGSLPVPYKKGHIFNGWYDKATGGTKLRDIDICHFTDDKTYYAQFSPLVITITFDSQNGTKCTPITATYGNVLGTLPVPERGGYVFVGWYDSTLGGNLVTSTTISNYTNNITLYARWTLANE